MENAYVSLAEEAWQLVHSLAVGSERQDGLGTMSPAAYDTAWVAMTERNGKPLFPEAYDYLKRTQSQDGSWAAETSDADGIINTLAALLALKRQERRFEEVRADNERRCQAAETSVRRMLATWDLEATDRVGMEVLVPNLLRLLEAEGISFTFPCREPLMRLNSAKLARLGPVLTSPVQTTLIHTLEAFVGGGDLKLDFNKVKQHKMPNGSMLASPSSTAAYLMNATEWDSEAEGYLRTVARQLSNRGENGGFPSAFPSTIFEISWVLDTLLESGFDKNDFLLADIRKLTVILETTLKENKGIVGWAPGCLPDADDTAKTISVLRLLGWEKEVEPMLKSFEADASFLTYRGERNASSSANCNVLSCLLRAPNPAKYTKQIVKCVNFLSKTWMRNNGPDKWHTSVQYPMMLIAQAFMLFLKRWGKNELDTDAVPDKVIYQDVPRTLLDILSRTMRAQHADGSWEYKREVTAYAVLTLAPLLSLPWVDFLKPEGIACMYRGKAYLENNRKQWRSAERIWIEKTVYASSNLAQAYCLAASKTVVPVAFMSEKISNMFPAQLSKKMAKMSGFFSQVNPFSESPKWKLQLSLLQSAQFAVALKGSRHDIFPRIEKASDEKYQEYIPFTWIGCRDVLSTAIPAETLWEMMLVSMFNFQVDAYMETAAWDAYKDRLPELKAFVRALCSEFPGKRKRTDGDGIGGTTKKLSGSNGAANRKSNGHSNSRVNGLSNGGGQNVRGRADSVITNESNGINGNGKKAENGVQNGSGTIANGHGFNDAEAEESLKQNGNAVGCMAHVVASDTPKSQPTIGEGPSTGLSGDDLDPQERLRSDVKKVLTNFVHFALQHPKVLQSPRSLRVWLAQELQTFLLAHITHMVDCAEMSDSSDFSKGTVLWSKPRTTFFNWVRTTSADHTSCPYSFVFFLCLIGESGQSIISNVQQRYALEDACRHLATMCRQYNDFGSVVRDQEEKNLNSVNFPEFESSVKTGSSTEDILGRSKRDLLSVAEYERRCLNRVVGELEETLDPRVMAKLRLFIQVTDLYGHIYVARDIGIRRETVGKEARSRAMSG